jgi:cysteine desulfurase
VIGSFLPRAAQGCHWILSTVEHASVDAMVDPWIRAGGRVTRLAVDSRGLIRPEDLRAALDSPQTVLVTLNWVNNETGVILPIEEPGSICQAHGVPLHVDAAQAWGKIPLETAWKWAHFVTLSSHKIGAPSGTGVVVRGPLADEALIPLLRGTQERGERGGTENVLGIWLTGVAAEAVDPAAFASATMPLQAFLESELGSNFSNLIFNGSGAPRVPNTVNFSVKGVGKMDLVTALDLEGFCVSAGSACSAGVLKPSRVLEAMGLSAELATAAVRVSWTGDASVETMTGFVSALKQVLERARRSEVRA